MAYKSYYNYLADFGGGQIDSKLADEWLLESDKDFSNIVNRIKHDDRIATYGIEPMELCELVEG
jgi:hypothetical protein